MIKFNAEKNIALFKMQMEEQEAQETPIGNRQYEYRLAKKDKNMINMNCGQISIVCFVQQFLIIFCYLDRIRIGFALLIAL